MSESEVRAFIQQHIPDDELQAFYHIANNPASRESGVTMMLKSIAYLVKKYANTKDDDFKTTFAFVMMAMLKEQQNRPRRTHTDMNVNPYYVSI
jgi:hypothetical protein